MKILFICPFINNAHFMESILINFDKYIKNDDYKFLCLNDAPDIDNNEENYLHLISILSKNINCYKEIKDECLKNNVTHIKVPQNIHTKYRPNHGSQRHGELCNWFLQNIDKVYPSYSEYDFLCLYDADLFLVDSVDFNIELNNVDFSCPIIHFNNGIKCPQPSIFFINLKNVKNFKELDFSIDNRWGNDMGSSIYNFWKKYPQYNIKEIGKFNGFQNSAFEKESDTIKQIDGHYYDYWMNGKFVHLRWGWGGGAGETQQRNNDNLKKYIEKIKKVFVLYNIPIDFEKWLK
mgnify:CR=1 FL=1|tara:strand:- start:663 stop:1535 length:873 start_codon:yes stop_codon:yes gene_type:complete